MSKQRPFEFDLVDLPDEGKTLEGAVAPEALDLEDEERLAFRQPIKYRLQLSAINAGHDLLLQGNVTTDVEILCDRCDEIASFHLINPEICHQYENAFGTTLDLTDDIREDILFSLPQHFLCKEDCRGFCLKCGQNLNVGTCNCSDSEKNSEPVVPEKNPWSCLDGIFDEKNDD